MQFLWDPHSRLTHVIMDIKTSCNICYALLTVSVMLVTHITLHSFMLHTFAKHIPFAMCINVDTTICSTTSLMMTSCTSYTGECSIEFPSTGKALPSGTIFWTNSQNEGRQRSRQHHRSKGIRLRDQIGPQNPNKT